MALVLQFFEVQVFAALDEKSVEAIRSGKEGAKMILAQPLSAIVPKPIEGPFRGSARDRLLSRETEKEYQGYVVPAGSAVEWAVGERGQEIAGAWAFMSVEEDGLVDLGVGSSKVLSARFDAWKDAQS